MLCSNFYRFLQCNNNIGPPEGCPSILECGRCDRQLPGTSAAMGERPRHYTAKHGSDEGGNPVNDAGLRLDFSITSGFCVLTLRPSIDFNRGHCVY